MTHDPLLQPLTIKGLMLKNRIMSAAHAPGYAEHGLALERYQLYHEEKAKGGLALTMFGGSATISPDSPSIFGQLDVSTDRCLESLHAFADRIHRHDCAIMCQITHMGRRTRSDVADRLPIVGPSLVREPLHRGFVKEMDLSDIQRIIDDYGAAARRCRDAGLDGVEILASSHLIGQFLSPMANRRSDGYGGSLENRARFCLEVLESVRRAVGDDYIVSLRLSGDEILAGELSPGDSLQVAKYLAEFGVFDVLNVIGSNSSTEPGASKLMPGMGTPTAPYLEFAAEMRRQVGLPIFHGTRITDIETARHAVANNMLDMVCMTRSHMADPEVVAKLKRGDADRIRPCVGARYCLDLAVYGGGSACIHNPATGRERTVPQLIRKSNSPGLDVVVIGGGPAGLEAARACALRGHKVRIFEAGQKLGGQVLTAGRARGRSEISEVVGWLARECEHARVDINLGTYIDAESTLDLKPQIVIDASGGLPTIGDVMDQEGIAVSTWDVLNGQKQLSGNVLLYDNHGGHQGLSCAATLSPLPNVKLTIATPEHSLGIELDYPNRPQYMEVFYREHVCVKPDLRLLSVEKDGNCVQATFQNVYSEAIENCVFDHVVIEAGTEPNTMIYVNGGAKPGHWGGVKPGQSGRGGGRSRSALFHSAVASERPSGFGVVVAGQTVPG